MCIRNIAEDGLFNDLNHPFANKTGQRGGKDNHPRDMLESGRALEISPAPLTPEVKDNGDHSAGVQHDQKQGHLRRRRVQAHKLFGDDYVGGTGDGQQLGQALDDGQDDELKKGHVLTLGGGAMRTSAMAADRWASRLTLGTRPVTGRVELHRKL